MTRDNTENRAAFNPQRAARAFGVFTAFCGLSVVLTSCGFKIDPDGPFEVNVARKGVKLPTDAGAITISNADISLTFGNVNNVHRNRNEPSTTLNYRSIGDHQSSTVVALAPNADDKVAVAFYPNGHISAQVQVVTNGTPTIDVVQNPSCPNANISFESGEENFLVGVGVPPLLAGLVNQFDGEGRLNKFLVDKEFIPAGYNVKARSAVVECSGGHASFNNRTVLTVLGVADPDRAQPLLPKFSLGNSGRLLMLTR